MPMQRSRPSRSWGSLLVRSLVLLRASAFLEETHRCAGCLALVDEIHFQLEQEPAHANIAVGDQNNRVFVPYANSETRAYEVLDRVCSAMSQYFENEDARDVLTNETFARFDKFNVDRGALTGNQLHLLTRRSKSSYHSNNLKVYCDALKEDLEEDLVESIKAETVRMDWAFCHKHERCEKRRAFCCSEYEIYQHLGWKYSLETVDDKLVDEYYKLAKDKDGPGEDGFAKKAHRLYLNEVRRQRRRATAATAVVTAGEGAREKALLAQAQMKALREREQREARDNAQREDRYSSPPQSEL